MPRKVYMVAHLGCANCAAKMEEKINKLPQVEQATLTFATKQLAVAAPDPDALLPQLQAIVSSIETEAVIVDTQHRHDTHCACGHDHHHEHHHDCACGHDHHSHDHHNSHGEKERSQLLFSCWVWCWAGLFRSSASLRT